jgi:hypothetical protein
MVLKAPSTPQTCTIQFQMVEGENDFFGELLTVSIQVIKSSDPMAQNLRLESQKIMPDGKGRIAFTIRNAGQVTAPAHRVELWASPDREFWMNQDPAKTGWKRVATGGAVKRDGHAMAYDELQNKVVLFGGNKDGLKGDTWEYSPAGGWVEVKPAASPSPRQNHAMVYDRKRGKVILFGGNDGRLKGDTWEYASGQGWTCVATTGPSPRSDHAMVYDDRRGKVILFGGYDGQDKGDLWEYTPGAGWSLVNTSGGPLPRMGHAMAFDSARNRLVLFGGRHEVLLGDTWEYTPGHSWQQVNSSVGSARENHSMIYDPRRGRTILFGGHDLVTYNYRCEVWEYIPGRGWIDRPILGPITRAKATLVYDSRRGKMVMFGGWDSFYLGDTWEATCGGNDIFLGSRWIAALAPGQSTNVTMEFNPSAAGWDGKVKLEPGTYSIAVLVDTQCHVPCENNENNVFINSMPLTILRRNAAREWTAYE